MLSKKIILKSVLLVVFFALLAAAAYGSFFVWKINQVEKKINVNSDNNLSVLHTFKNLTSQDPIKLKGADQGRINVLLLGIAGTKKGGRNLTDTIMIASLNTKTDQVALLSIPRDLYITLPDQNSSDAKAKSFNFSGKINSAYQYGLELYPNDQGEAVAGIEEAVQDITSLDIDYWVVVNFNGFEKVIDTIGGINVMNERDIYDPTYPGPGYSYETFQLKKGLQHLDGATALKYARMRHDDPEGDFGRAKRQQQVLQAVKNKVFSAGTLTDAVALNSLLDALGDNVKTNISAAETGDFLRLSKELDTANITNVVFDAWNAESLLKVSHLEFGGVPAFVLIPRVGNWSETRELAKNIFNLKKIQADHQKIVGENASVAIINKSGNSLVLQRIQALLKENFGYKNVVILNDPDRSTVSSSALYDLTGGKKPFTLSEMATKLPATVSYAPDDSYKKLVSGIQTDIILVIGKDLITKYNMVEDSVKDYTQAKDTNAYTEQRSNR